MHLYVKKVLVTDLNTIICLNKDDFFVSCCNLYPSRCVFYFSCLLGLVSNYKQLHIHFLRHRPRNITKIKDLLIEIIDG